ncbi:MAG: murein L,D-transpeptidase catalytic domain family protein [Deltaproteobacteria bacterium]|nr:murein L,D-transpeptidase catalytic domain family protein [Deltaproteobacteria bacterium]
MSCQPSMRVGLLKPTSKSWCLALSLTLGAAACGSPAPVEPEGEDGIGVLREAYSVDPNDFVLPPSDATERAEIMSHYTHLDPKDEVPRGLLEDAVEFMVVNKANVPVQTFVTVVDFSKFSGDDRFFLVNMTTGAVEPHKVAHGDGSDPSHTGWAVEFSNVSGSHMTSLGFYLAGEIYDGTHVHSMRLDGISADGSPNQMANTNARSRAIVVHEASYVSDSNTSKQGRSNGCLALDPDIEVEVVDRIHDGSLIYAAIAPLNPPIGKTPIDAGTDAGEGPDSGAEADSGSVTPDAAEMDSGSQPVADSASIPEGGSAGSPSDPDGGNPKTVGVNEANSSSAGGCAMTPKRSPGEVLGFSAAVLALGALGARRRRRRASLSP